MKKAKRIASFIMCLAMASAMSVTAFAAPAETASVMSSKDDTYITLWNHTDVVVRQRASTSASKVHTLYQGDTVYIYDWVYATADGYDWAYLRHYDSSLQTNIFGYSANCYLS